MRTYIFIPPLRSLTGGTAVLLQIARHLHDDGHEVCLVLREKTTPLPASVCDLPLIPWEALCFAPQDIWLVPEGWVNALAPGLQRKARCVVYVQNWAYLLSSLPQGVQWSQLGVSFLAVSHPVAWFTREATDMQATILRPGIDLERFCPPERKPESAVCIAWMPRKNKALALRIREFFDARRTRVASPPVEWQAIHGLAPDEVAAQLREAHVFLATGFPEGCPLPPLEAMACGCVVTGFSGMGGWDYMRQAAEEAYTPWWPQRAAHETPWGGNGFFTADADVPAAALALERAVHLIEAARLAPHPLLGSVLQNAQTTVAHYSLERQRKDVLEIWAQAARGALFT